MQRINRLTALVAGDITFTRTQGSDQATDAQAWALIKAAYERSKKSNSSKFQEAVKKFEGQSHFRTRVFQYMNGLTPDGIAGPKTRAKAFGTDTSQTGQTVTREDSGQQLTSGSYGVGRNVSDEGLVKARRAFDLGRGFTKDANIKTVADFQKYMGIPVDGKFGKQTATAYRNFLKRREDASDNGWNRVYADQYWSGLVKEGKSW